jgi:hypothetical protein
MLALKGWAMTSKFLFFGLILFSISAFGQNTEPIRFRGAYIGEPLSDFVDCSAKKVLKDGHKMHGNICEGKRGVVEQTHTHFMNSKEEGEIFMFDNRSLFKIVISIPNTDWEKVKYDLTQRLGEPQSEVPTVYQNGFGARWEYDQGFWSNGSIVAYAGIKVAHLGSQAIKNPWTNQPDLKGIQITITDAVHARLPSTTPNTLD